MVVQKGTHFLKGCEESGETEKIGVTTIKIGVQANHFHFAIYLESKRLYHHGRRRLLARFGLDGPMETN
jgi:hypothetical protein